jgi:hypothetical protein
MVTQAQTGIRRQPRFAAFGGARCGDVFCVDAVGSGGGMDIGLHAWLRRFQPMRRMRGSWVKHTEFRLQAVQRLEHSLRVGAMADNARIPFQSGDMYNIA